MIRKKNINSLFLFKNYVVNVSSNHDSAFVTVIQKVLSFHSQKY